MTSILTVSPGITVAAGAHNRSFGYSAKTDLKTVCVQNHSREQLYKGKNIKLVWESTLTVTCWQTSRMTIPRKGKCHPIEDYSIIDDIHTAAW
jgi:hypothetical protein